MTQKLPPELVEYVLQKAAAGVGFREIERDILADHGVTVSYRTLARVAEREGKQRSTAAKHVARAQLAKGVSLDVTRLERLYRATIAIAARNKLGDPATAIKAYGEARKILGDKLKIAGATPDENADGAGRSVIVVPPESND